MRQVVGFGDRSTGRSTFGGEFGARQCNQWGLYGVRVRQRRDAALFPNYFGQTCYYYYYYTLQVLGEPIAELFDSLTFVMLAGNPLHCNCELRWFRHWLSNDTESSRKVLDSGDVLCASPATMTGLRLKYIHTVDNRGPE